MTLDDDASPAPAPVPIPLPDPADLSRDLTAVLRGVPGVADVFAPRSPVLLVAQQVVEGVVAGSSTAAEQLVTVETGEGTVLVQASIAVDAAGRASDTARAAVDAIRARLAESVGPEAAALATVTVRVGSIG
ncbi:hypothetical protein [Clavibacter michiganensis]|uniref:Asp23/Gls24 family envelope stress response protein n=1 Tax=Clavibacter michiganensis subsp. michiganensis (strain NCPPB 382) TaxID=443906 RepID=A5CN63_CLAM3|nr:hypothetical protein [Clavibacter michiganensis]MWJ35353.1 hypothetical protein [Clavibacter michiganensis subsp. michiganensis]MWJ80084.1 hypothetical protein [Clavibacter michiganensis subsp. michiganensis]QIT10447.1 hypothetical protein GRD74_02625 [Clavibacter michiganensis subsp. michiganensis]UOW04211.1 hypothetical protein MU580_02740 [Clavibacter michiganensis subsp. michiganensis]CAN00500.1 hypothetical protein CMM_0476 [Clavibacter michiganensis subsp. michiganensis NCPPB 382]